ncbi:MAG: ATP-binding protein [bacterium]
MNQETDIILYEERLRIPASLEELHHVYSWADEHLIQTGIPDTKRFEIMLALSEAVTNAIRHGSSESPSEVVDIHVRISEHQVNIKVQDRGNGFSPDSLPDPTNAENLFVPNGRGVFLIKKLADEVHYDFTDIGTTLHVRFVV